MQVGPLAIDTKVFSAIALLAVANGALINMIMASRLLYGMARQRILPRGVRAPCCPSGARRSVAIVFTTLIAAGLIVLGELETLADTTVLLLLLVFAVVNVSVLVLRRDPVGARSLPRAHGDPRDRHRRDRAAADPDRGEDLRLGGGAARARRACSTG